jgi:beta-glucuronidase
MKNMDNKRISLSDSFWKFRFGIHTDEEKEDPGIVNEWYNGIPEDEDLLKVYVPSTWSYYLNRRDFYHFGTGWYETSFFMPHAWGAGDGMHSTLVFNGANYKSIIWINGKKVGYHEGGYTKFWFDITNFVTFGTDNQLVIQVDNRYLKNRIPWFNTPNWMNYGGIARPVYLKLTSKICIDDFKLTNEVEFVDPLGKGTQIKKAIVKVRISIKDFRPRHRRFDGILTMSLKHPTSTKTLEKSIKLDEETEIIVNCNMEVDEPHLWSPEDPYLYDIRFCLLNKKDRRELDREDIRWGIRDFQIHQKDFYLNNQRFILRGINYHEDHPDVGSSMNPRLIYNDLNIMKECNINCIRTTHYPPYHSLVDLADEMGMLIIEEIPVYRFKEEQYNANYLVNAQQQLWEMIHRDKNNCSVIAWVVACECSLGSPASVDFMKNLLELSKELDPYRLHTVVLHNDQEEIQAISPHVDFVCTNILIGWYDKWNIGPEHASDALDEIYNVIVNNGDLKPLVITAFGAEAISGFKSFANAHWSENYQYNVIKTYIKLFIQKGYIAGGFTYFQDFRCSPYGSFLNHPKEYNNKGIVDMHRNPKISYYILERMYAIWKDMVESDED